MIKKLLAFFAVLLTVFSMSLTIPSTPVSAASKCDNTNTYNLKTNKSGSKKLKVYVRVCKDADANTCTASIKRKVTKDGKTTYSTLTDDQKTKIKKYDKTKWNKVKKARDEQKSKCVTYTKTHATVNTKDVTGFSYSGECNGPLGLIPWYCNVDIHDEDSLKTGIWTIVANVLTDLTIIAAYLVIGYVIYGGYQYMLSNGDPGKVANGKKTLVQAFIGLAIVMLSNVILNTIRIALGNANFSADCTKNACMDPGDMVSSTIQWVIGVAGVVSAIFVVVGGISYTTSGGDPSKLQKAKQTILYALIGLAIVALAEIITAFVSNMIRTADQEAFNNTTTIAKEVHEIQSN